MVRFERLDRRFAESQRNEAFDVEENDGFEHRNQGEQWRKEHSKAV